MGISLPGAARDVFRTVLAGRAPATGLANHQVVLPEGWEKARMLAAHQWHTNGGQIFGGTIPVDALIARRPGNGSVNILLPGGRPRVAIAANGTVTIRAVRGNGSPTNANSDAGGLAGVKLLR